MVPNDIEGQLSALYRRPGLDQPISPPALLAAVHERRTASDSRRTRAAASVSALALCAALVLTGIALRPAPGSRPDQPLQPARSTTTVSTPVTPSTIGSAPTPAGSPLPTRVSPRR